MPSERIQRRIDSLLDEAERAADEHDWALVIERAEMVLGVDPGNEDARSLLAIARRGLGEDTAGGPGTPGTAQERPLVPAPPVGAGAPKERAEPLPAAFASGRYRVVRLLGQGGRKRVYLAHDTRLGRDVAVAAVQTAGLGSDGAERIRREARAMARLGDHPHIVAVFDTFDEDRLHLIVSQYVPGGDCADLLRRTLQDHQASADAPLLSLERAVAIASDVCRALSHAHERGIIHRDLKPANIFITDDGRVRLGDFGLARVLDASELTQAGSFVGTAAYMAPEQAMGAAVDARSDLYSLGCILYELLTGRPPFVGDGTVALITQHLNTQPIAPSWHRPDVPPALEALVLRLLEKDPAKRPSSAEETRAALASVDLTRTPPDQPAEPATRSSDLASDPVYRRTFVGREQELATLRAAFDAALAGSGGLAMVVGEPGIGKTAVCEQLATYVAMRGGRTLTGHCYEEGSLSLAYLPFIEALRAYVLAREPEALRTDLGSGAPHVARIISEIRDRIDFEPPPPVTVDEERFRLLQGVTTFLRNAASNQPLCLVLEDLHDADRGTLDLLAFLARNLEGARLLLVGTYRDVEVDRSHPLSGALAELRRNANFSRVVLRGLTIDETRRMLANISGRAVQPALAEAVFRQTEGNPLFIQEVIRYITEQGAAERDGGPRSAGPDVSLSEAIPEGLRDVIGKRLSRLGDACNAVLATAAVLGREFDFAVLAAISGRPEEEVLAAIEEAVAAAVVEDRSQRGEARYRFTHAFFRQALYEELIAPRRIRIHQQAARALEDRYATRLDEHAAELAEHFAHSSDPADLAKAVDYARRAASRAMAVFAHAEAVRLLEWALQVQEASDSSDEALHCDLLLDLCSALLATDQPVRVARDVAERAYGIADTLGDNTRASAACQAALIGLTDMGTYSVVMVGRGWAERADRHAVPGTVDRVHADVALSMIRGDRSLAEQAFEAARRLGDRDAFYTAAERLLVSESLYTEKARLEIATEVVAVSGDGIAARKLARCLRGASGAFAAWGDRDRFERVGRQLVGLAEGTGQAAAVASAIGHQCFLATIDGRLGDALAATARLASLETATVDAWWYRVYPAILLGRVEELVGEPPFRDSPVVQPLFMLCRAHTHRHVEFPPRVLFNAAWCLVPWLEVAVLQGDSERAAGYLEALAPAMAPVTDMGYFTLIDRHRAAAYTLLGDPDRARSHYTAAISAGQAMRFRPEVALSRLGLAGLLLEHFPAEHREAIAHLDFCIQEFREMGMTPSLEKALGLKLEAQGASSTDPRASIDVLAASIGAERPDLVPRAAPDGTVTILFSDIEGSTSLNVELGDDRWMEVLADHNAKIRECIAAHRGFEVKTEGDAFMVAFGSARDGLRCAQAIQRAFAEHQQSAVGSRQSETASGGRQPAVGSQQSAGTSATPGAGLGTRNSELGTGGPVRVRIGLHTGEPVKQGDDFYGTHVVMASRIAAQAKGGEILVSALLRELVAASGEFGLEARPAVTLKGLAGEHVTYAVRWASRRV